MVKYTKNGWDLAFGVQNTEDTIKGLEMALTYNENKDLKGLAIAPQNYSLKGQGSQLGWENKVKEGKYLFQLGGTNYAEKIDGLEAALIWNIAEIVKGAQAALFYNRAKEVYGGQLGQLNRAEKVRGVQLGGISEADDIVGGQISAINRAKKMRGLDLYLLSLGGQLGIWNELEDGEDMKQIGVYNHAKKYSGWQFGGLNNIDEGVGLQAGVANYSEKYSGWQAGAVNTAKEVSGAQTGIVNAAKKFNGVQFGLFNVCDEGSKGLQVGLLNYRRGSGPWYKKLTLGLAFRG